MCFSSVFQLIETMCTPVVTVGVYCMFASGMLGSDDNSYQHYLVPFYNRSGSVVSFWCFGKKKLIDTFSHH